jgi:hypothetical protein
MPFIDHAIALPSMCASAYAHSTYKLFKRPRSLSILLDPVANRTDRAASYTTPLLSQEQRLGFLQTSINRRKCFNVRPGCGRMADTLPRTMSTREQRSEPNSSTQASGGQQLTATNLAAHNQNNRAVSAGQAVRSWLNDIDTSNGRHVDGEAWRRLVATDHMAADIEAVVGGGHQRGAH